MENTFCLWRLQGGADTNDVSANCYEFVMNFGTAIPNNPLHFFGLCEVTQHKPTHAYELEVEGFCCGAVRLSEEAAQSRVFA